MKILLGLHTVLIVLISGCKRVRGGAMCSSPPPQQDPLLHVHVVSCLFMQWCLFLLLFQQVCLVTCNSDSAWNSHLIGQKHRKVIAESSLSPDLNCRVVRCLASKQACAENSVTCVPVVFLSYCNTDFPSLGSRETRSREGTPKSAREEYHEPHEYGICQGRKRCRQKRRSCGSHTWRDIWSRSLT